MKILINKKIFWKLREFDRTEAREFSNHAKLNFNALNFRTSYEVESLGLYGLVSENVTPILKGKGFQEREISPFVESFLSNVDPEHMIDTFTHIASPPFELLPLVNKITDINEMCKEKNVKNVDWLKDFKFPGGANVGSYEGFIKVLFKDTYDPSTGGDVGFTNSKGEEELIEVKGDSGRLRGQHGYTNGMIQNINQLTKKNNVTLPENFEYKLCKNTITNINTEIESIKKELTKQQDNYNTKLKGKKLRMMAASSNKSTKKYKTAKKAYNKFLKTIPVSVTSLYKKIDEKVNKINTMLEYISIEIGKKSLRHSIDFWIDLFSKKYPEAEKSKIEKFVKTGLNDDGSFNEHFLKEYFIFEYEYYQQIEEFKYFCLVNLSTNKQLIIDNNESFRKFVESGNICIKFYPNFSSRSGNQGEVFGIELVA